MSSPVAGARQPPLGPSGSPALRTVSPPTGPASPAPVGGSTTSWAPTTPQQRATTTSTSGPTSPPPAVARRPSTDSTPSIPTPTPCWLGSPPPTTWANRSTTPVRENGSIRSRGLTPRDTAPRFPTRPPFLPPSPSPASPPTPTPPSAGPSTKNSPRGARGVQTSPVPSPLNRSRSGTSTIPPRCWSTAISAIPPVTTGCFPPTKTSPCMPRRTTTRRRRLGRGCDSWPRPTSRPMPTPTRSGGGSPPTAGTRPPTALSRIAPCRMARRTPPKWASTPTRTAPRGASSSFPPSPARWGRRRSSTPSGLPCGRPSASPTAPSPPRLPFSPRMFREPPPAPSTRDAG